MAPRKAHTKSRTGCRTCKSRHVKCDELGPPCSNCIKRELDCVNIPATPNQPMYQFPQSHVPTPAPTPTSTTCSNDQSLEKHFPPPTDLIPETGLETVPMKRGRFCVRDLELMHLYSTSSYKSLLRVDSDDTEGLWRDFVPQESLRHEFLLNGLLTFTSLHLASLRPSEAQMHFQAALEFQNVAFRQFRSVVLDIDPQNCHAAFAFAIITMINAMAMSTVPTVVDTKGPVEHILSVYNLLQGVRSIVDLCRETIHSGPLGRVMFAYSPAEPVVLEDGTKIAFLVLRGLNAESGIGTAKYTTYRDTIDSLERFFTISHRHLDRGSVLAWLVLNGSEYPKLLSDREPMAQAILIYFAVRFAKSIDRWWGSGERLLKDLAHSLLECGPPWDVPANWALEQIK